MSSEATPVNTVGYCRTCGKALDESTVRSAQGTIYCAEHVPGASQPPPVPPNAPYSAPYQQPVYTAPPYSSPYTGPVPPRTPESDVSPGLAFVLGLIPGVGAIYNGQYAKGLVHVFILGLLFTVVSEPIPGGMEPLVGLLIAGFWAYMPFEAYHTAQKRRLGQPVDEFSGLTRPGGVRFPAAPILLMAIGVIFLLNNLGVLEFRRAIRYWPVLMIALGAYMLWGRIAAGRKGDPQ